MNKVNDSSPAPTFPSEQSAPKAPPPPITEGVGKGSMKQAIQGDRNFGKDAPGGPGWKY